MRDFNITRQIYLREFLIEYNKMYIPANKDDIEEELAEFLTGSITKHSEYATYSYFIERLEDENLTKEGFDKFYFKDKDLQLIHEKVGSKIIEKEQNCQVFTDFDLFDRQEIIENTFKYVTQKCDNLYDEEVESYDINQIKFQNEIIKIKDDFYSIEEKAINGYNYSYPHGLLNLDKYFHLNYDFVIKHEILNEDKNIEEILCLKNFSLALIKSAKLIALAKCIQAKYSGKNDRFNINILKKESFLEKANLLNFSKILSLKSIKSSHNLIILCFIKHYLNLTDSEIEKLSDIVRIGKKFDSLFTYLYKTIFPNYSHLE